MCDIVCVSSELGRSKVFQRLSSCLSRHRKEKGYLSKEFLILYIEFKSHGVEINIDIKYFFNVNK